MFLPFLPGFVSLTAPLGILFFLSSFARGLYIVVVGWAAVSLTESVAATGRVFLIGHLVLLFLGPFAGVLVDKFSHSRILFVGQALNLAAFGIPVLAPQLGAQLTIFHLYVVALLNGIGVLTMAGALERYLANSTEPEARRRAIAFAGAVNNVSLVTGIFVAGYAIHYSSITTTFAIGGVTCVLVAMLSQLLPPNHGPATSSASGSYWRSISEGMSRIVSQRSLLVLSLVTSMSFSVGQLTNALLPGFVKLDLNLESDALAILDASWACGGILCSVLLAKYILEVSSSARIACISLILLGFVTFIVSMVSILSFAAIFLFLMGFFFSSTRIVADALTLDACPAALVGRVRLNQQSLTSLFGVAMYLSPTILGAQSSQQLFSLWGLFICIFGFFLAWVARGSS